MKKKLAAMVLALGAMLVAWAEPVSLNLAAHAVNTLISESGPSGIPIKGTVSSVRLCAAPNGAAFYVAKLTGGGFVVTSTDTDIDPIIAISSASDLVEDSQNPLWALLVRDMANRQKSVAENNKASGAQASAGASGKAPLSSAASRWARLTSSRLARPSVDSSCAGAAGAGKASISDVRVEPLLKTKWGQSSVGGQPCFNYYTPNKYLCGCTATAGAQILRYHKFPDYYVDPQTYECLVDGWPEYLDQIGGYYDWDNMPEVPGRAMTQGQREAIGKLTYDVGVAVGSEYSRNVTWGYGDLLVDLFLEWGYSHATTFHYSAWHDREEEGEGFLEEELKSVLIPNLDAKLPVCVRIYDIKRENDTAHFAVADGYGYMDGQLSVHLNMGWDGYCDAWYVLPEFRADVLYTTINYLYGNIYPFGPERGGIVSGRVLSSSTSKPVSGVGIMAQNGDGDVLYATTDAKGVYAFILPEDTDWEISIEGVSSSPYSLDIEDNENYYGLDFSVPTHTVTLDANGGKCQEASRAVVDGSAIGVLPEATRNGFAFDGWYTAAAGGEQIDVDEILDRDVTCYAHWTKTESIAPGVDFNATLEELGYEVPSGDEPYTFALKGLPSGLKYDAKNGRLSGKVSTPGVYEVTVTAKGKSKATTVSTVKITVANFTDDEIPVRNEYGPYIPGVEYNFLIPEAENCQVSELPSGMKWTAKDIVDSKTKLVKVPANSVYGAAAKPGNYTVYFTKTVKETDDNGKQVSVKHTATATFVVGPFPKLTVKVVDSGTGKVTGDGEYAANKKVTLKAAANKGSVFGGWYETWNEEEGLGNGDEDGLISKQASLSFAMGEEDVVVYARFVKAEDDEASISFALNGNEMTAAGSSNPPYQTNVWAGVYLEWSLTSTALSQTTVKVSGLPAGLKFTANDIMKKGSKTEVEIPANTIYGVPTAASKTGKDGKPTPSKVKVTVTTAGKSSATYEIALTVNPLPAWTVGSFEGFAATTTTPEEFGPASMSATAAGKVSGKFSILGTNWTFKADSYVDNGIVGPGIDEDGVHFVYVDATATAGKAVRKMIIMVIPFGLDLCPDSAISYCHGIVLKEGVDSMQSESDAEWQLLMYRIPWADKGDTVAASVVASYAGAYSCTAQYGTETCPVAFTLDEKGVIKGTVEVTDGNKARKVSFSTHALPYYDPDGLSAFIAIPADLKKGYPEIFAYCELVNHYDKPKAEKAYRNPGVIASSAAYDDLAAAGTVSVSPKYGQVAAGKEVTLTAKAASGSVFSHWEIAGADIDGLDLASPKLKVVAPGDADVSATAVFVTVAEDAGYIHLFVDGAELPPSPAEEVPKLSAEQGSPVSWPVETWTHSAATVKASGLPKGLKLVQDKTTKAYSVAGTPTAPSKKDAGGEYIPSVAKFTVTTAGKSSETFELAIVVVPTVE